MSDEDIERIANRTAEILLTKLAAPTSDSKLLSRKESAKYLGYSPRGFDNCSQQQRFPAPIRPTGGDPYWKRSDLDKWLERTKG
jgi:predicted DNA-binding transcriptional regulator AlpA